jgi:hypothetical protein
MVKFSSVPPEHDKLSSCPGLKPGVEKTLVFLFPSVYEDSRNRTSHAQLLVAELFAYTTSGFLAQSNTKVTIISPKASFLFSARWCVTNFGGAFFAGVLVFVL